MDFTPHLIPLLASLAFTTAILKVGAQYAPLETPESYTFSRLTPAFSPDGAGDKLGDFQSGLRVQVLEARPDSRQWLVAYERYGAPDIRALIGGHARDGRPRGDLKR